MSEIDWDSLRQAAIAARDLAYAPYSRYPVGAAALTAEGEIISGCNVENASYGLTLCAECTLLGALRLAGGSKLRALICVNAESEIITPCGRCRQLLYEHAASPMRIAIAQGQSITIEQLLPAAFSLDACARQKAGDECQ